MIARALSLAAALILSGCSSAPARYYTLISDQQQASRVTTASARFQFEMLPVRIPVQVDQPSLMVRESTGSLAILESARWASPLADELHDALAKEMERRLGVRDLAGMPKRAGQPLLRLRTDVRRFESESGGQATLDAVWNLSLSRGENQQRNITCSSVFAEPAGADLDELVAAHQRAVAALADAIATTARQWVDDPNFGCL
jgi:uncharacterized lipoprotein YmbA